MTMVQPPPTQACRRSSSTASSQSSPSTRRRLRSSTRRAAATTSARPPPPLATVRTAYRKPCPRLTPYDVCRSGRGMWLGFSPALASGGVRRTRDLVASPALSRARASLTIALVFCDQLLRSQRPHQRRRLSSHEATLELSPADRPTGMRVCVCVCVQPRRCLVRHRRLRRCRAVRR